MLVQAWWIYCRLLRRYVINLSVNTNTSSASGEQGGGFQLGPRTAQPRGSVDRLDPPCDPGQVIQLKWTRSLARYDINMRSNNACYSCWPDLLPVVPQLVRHMRNSHIDTSQGTLQPGTQHAVRTALPHVPGAPGRTRAHRSDELGPAHCHTPASACSFTSHPADAECRSQGGASGGPGGHKGGQCTL